MTVRTSKQNQEDKQLKECQEWIRLFLTDFGCVTIERRHKVEIILDQMKSSSTQNLILAMEV